MITIGYRKFLHEARRSTHKNNLLPGGMKFLLMEMPYLDYTRYDIIFLKLACT